MREVRKNFQMIFQDPYASLNPRMTVEDIVARTFRWIFTNPYTQIKRNVEKE